ncbi:MAG: ATP synthase subunit I [Cellvibrio sp.]|uniref:ATP synthase subunit I n=1 Tax=Cellvibrio sp. TaxID=1965322 RepID=UPI002717B5E8|nr:ATP synthase subunit I [Cellvibrio sp.]
MSRYIKGRDIALKVVITQFVVILMIGTAGLAINQQIAIALFTGGIICVTANLWLALVAFRPPLGASPQKILAAFYVGELGKFVITALLFLLAFKQIALLKHAPYAATMILAYVLVQAIAWLYPLVRSPAGRS